MLLADLDPAHPFRGRRGSLFGSIHCDDSSPCDAGVKFRSCSAPGGPGASHRRRRGDGRSRSIWRSSTTGAGLVRAAPRAPELGRGAPARAVIARAI
jgi:hypothetical protein